VGSDPEAMFDLVYGEFLLREELEGPAPLSEYRRRFPQLADSLWRQVGFRTALDVVPATGPAAASEAPPPWPHGPGYEILGELGKGGMGVVYQANQTALKRLVALKMIRGDAGGEERARFRAEAEAVARLQHPNIVQVFEVGELPMPHGRPFFSMEYVGG